MSRSLCSGLVTTSNSFQGDVLGLLLACENFPGIERGETNIADDVQLAVYAVVVVPDRTRFAGSRSGAIDYLVGCGNDVIYRSKVEGRFVLLPGSPLLASGINWARRHESNQRRCRSGSEESSLHCRKKGSSRRFSVSSS